MSDDVPRSISRRRFLGGVAAGTAAVAAGQVLGASPAAASAYYMKWGAVCSPAGDFGTKVALLRRMRPQTVRVSMFWNSPGARRFSDGQLDQLLGTGLNEMIIQTSEDPDPALARQQVDQILPYVDAHPGILFVVELGNEPDWHSDAGGARARRLATIRDNKPFQDRGNLMWAVNMPAGRADVPGGSGGYFTDFVRDWSDGLGGMFSGPYRPDIVTAHCYSWDYLRRYPGRGEDNPYKMVDYVRGWAPGFPLKITEAGINALPADRGYRYVEFGNGISSFTGGVCDSVCFYGLPDVEPSYPLRGSDVDQVGAR